MTKRAAFENQDPVARHAELDRSINTSSLVLTVVIAVVSLFFWSRSPVLVFAAWSILIARGVRYLVVDNQLALYRWAICNGVISSASVVAASAVTGGITSPILVFSIVTGLLTAMLFTHRPIWNLLPLAIVGTVAAIDWLDGGLQQVDVLWPVAIVLAAASTPQLISEMVSVDISYRAKAVLDPLTNCLNRSSMTQRMNELQLQASQTDSEIGVIAIDIDRFKVINDDHGHAAGDQVLQQVADTIRRNLRRFELLYRTGGEEFVLLLPGASAEAAFALAESIRVAVADERFATGQVTISLGVASEEAPDNLARLIESADQALLESKRNGRNQSTPTQTAQQVTPQREQPRPERSALPNREFRPPGETR